MTSALFFVLGLLLGVAALAVYLRPQWQRLQQQDVDLASVREQLSHSQQRLAEQETLRSQYQHSQQQQQSLREKISALEAQWESQQQFQLRLNAERDHLLSENRAMHQDVTSAHQHLARLQEQLKQEQERFGEKLSLLEEAKATLGLQFQHLAQQIFEDKAKRFSETSQVQLDQLLSPLKLGLTEFKTRMENIHVEDTRQRTMLSTELEQLKQLNQQITQEAHSLATALKGQAKKQGNWGELVLENVLDRSGLRLGHDYERESSYIDQHGERKRPDVVVRLPQNKHLVIDAKVSLNAYTRYVNAEDELSRSQALKEHTQAMAQRIDELSERGYADLPGLNSPEMVFMFVPIESAFVEAIRADEGLFQRALEKKILLATPTTLLTSLNIVRQLWRFELQNAHTQELAKSASGIYKKLVSFVDNMERLSGYLGKAQKTHEEAMGQLVHGKNNLIQQVQRFEKLGVDVQQRLPQGLLERAEMELGRDIEDEEKS